MKYKLKAYTIWEKGHFRPKQEDSVYPKKGEVTDDDRMFILCDGMGGHEKGEVASATVCDVMSSYISEHSNADKAVGDDVIRAAVNAAIDALDELDSEDVVKKMGTTMTFLNLHDEGATVAHIGDSRVYHIRPGVGILHVTRDHTLVNDLLKIGEITEEEARVSKQKHLLTRAMMPHQERRPKVDITHIDDIQPGDFFYMCSDGMYENINDAELVQYLSNTKIDDAKRVETLLEMSDLSHDNHSAHVIRITDVTGKPLRAARTDDEQSNSHGGGIFGKNKKQMVVTLVCVLLTGIAAIAIMIATGVISMDSVKSVFSSDGPVITEKVVDDADSAANVTESDPAVMTTTTNTDTQSEVMTDSAKQLSEDKARKEATEPDGEQDAIMNQVAEPVPAENTNKESEELHLNDLEFKK